MSKIFIGKTEIKTTIGVERERFIIDLCHKRIVPVIGTLLPVVQKIAKSRKVLSKLFGYELFAGQIEDRTMPCKSLEDLKKALIINDQILEKAASQFGFGFDFTEFAEESQILNLVVNPFDKRHKNIWESLSPERCLAASRVISTHVHIGVEKPEVLKLLNFCDEKTITRLASIGDHSNGKRILAYRTMTQSKSIPPNFSTIDELLCYIQKNGGERDVWDLVRYKPSTKTIEFRMFGATENIEEVLNYVKVCLDLFQACTK